MANITFYTKTNCINAKKQIELLKLSGHTLEVVDLLSYNWTREKLLQYFGTLEPELWFNLKAPKVKSGVIVPEKYSTEETIELLLEDHLLIRRPIIESEGSFQIGFDKEKLDEWIGLSPQNEKDAALFSMDVNTCHQEKTNSPDCDQ